MGFGILSRDLRVVLEGQGKDWEWLGWWLAGKASKEWLLEGSGLGPKLQFGGALVHVRVMERLWRSPEKAVRDPETPKNLEKPDL